MSSLYLEEVALSNFRTYGPDAAIKLHPGPGLTILCGMNGLGKTGFFDGVEWCLTGDVKRLSARGDIADVIGRINRDGPYAVTMTFSNKAKIRRIENQSVRPESVISLLRAEHWQPAIRDLSPYIRLTHLLPQSNYQRFVEVGPDRQWELLRGPAGVDRIDRLRNLLSTKKVRNAFRREIEVRELRLRELKEKEARMLELRGRQVELRALASANAALSPQDCHARALGILQELREHEASWFEWVEEQPTVEFVTELSRQIDKWQLDVERRSSQIATAEELVLRWEQSEQRRLSLEGKEKLVGEILGKREAAAKEAEQKTFQVKAALDEATKAVASYEMKAETFGLALQARQRLTTWRQEAAAVDKELATVKLELQKAQAELKAVGQAQIARQALLRQQVELQRTDSLVDEAAKLLELLAKHRKEADEAEAERKRLAQSVTIATEQSAQVRIKIVAAKNTIEPLEREMHISQRTASAVAKAVAEITTNLTENDTVCPVCAKNHPPRQLMEAARNSIKRLHAGDVRLAEQLATAKINLRVLEAELDTLTKRQQEVNLGSGSLDAIIQRFNATKVRVHSHEILAGVLPTQFAQVIVNRKQEVTRQRVKLAEEIAAGSPNEVLEAREMSAAEGVNKVQGQLETLQKQLADAQRHSESEQAFLTSNRSLLSDLPASLVDAAEMRTKIMGQLEDQKKRLMERRVDLKLAEEELQNRLKDLSQTRVEKIQREVERELEAASWRDLRARWREWGFEDAPNESALNNRRAQLREYALLGKQGQEQLATLAQGLTMWDSSQELVKIEIELAEIAKYATEQIGSVDEFPAAVGKAAAAVRQSTEAFHHATTTSETLHEQAGRFSSAALAPLNGRIARFNSVISPFAYKYQVSAKVKPTFSDIQQNIEIWNADGAAVKDINPLTHLSEGQTSALGLSVLFAGATEYPWSRWPALLMDDPLQNTDLIHASAFVDVIRGMILERNFQVIISTHDMDEAEYIGRKCLRGGVKVTRTELVGPGPNGVRLRDRPLAS